MIGGTDNNLQKKTSESTSELHPLLERYKGDVQLILLINKIETIFGPVCFDKFLVNNAEKDLKIFLKFIPGLILEYEASSTEQDQSQDKLKALISCILQEKKLSDNFFNRTVYNSHLGLLKYIAPLSLSNDLLTQIFLAQPQPSSALKLKILNHLKFSLTATLVNDVLGITALNTLENIHRLQKSNLQIADLQEIITKLQTEPELLDFMNKKDQNNVDITRQMLENKGVLSRSLSIDQEALPHQKMESTQFVTSVMSALTPQQKNLLNNKYGYDFLLALHQSWIEDSLTFGQMKQHFEKLCEYTTQDNHIVRMLPKNRDISAVNDILRATDNTNIAVTIAEARLESMFSNVDIDRKLLNKFYDKEALITLYMSNNWVSAPDEVIKKSLIILSDIACAADRQPEVEKIVTRLRTIDANFRILNNLLTYVDQRLPKVLLLVLGIHLYTPNRNEREDDKFLTFILTKKKAHGFLLKAYLSGGSANGTNLHHIFNHLEIFQRAVENMYRSQEARTNEMRNTAALAEEYMIKSAEQTGLSDGEIQAWKKQRTMVSDDNFSARLALLQQQDMQLLLYQKYIDIYNVLYSNTSQGNSNAEWYDCEKIQRLFQAEDHTDVLVISNSVLPFWRDDGRGLSIPTLETLGDQLLSRLDDFKKRNIPNPNKYYIPFQIHSNHWIGVFVDNSKEQPAVYWMDSLGQEPPPAYQQGLIHLLNTISICGDKPLTLDNFAFQNERLQNDYHSCGDWLFEMLDRYLNSGKFPLKSSLDDSEAIRVVRQNLDAEYAAIQVSMKKP